MIILEKVIFMAVMNDDVELPVAIADNIKDLGKIIGRTERAIYHAMSAERVTKKSKYKYIRVVINE